jgi:uncharacterized delta-60 repeat protein
MHAGTSVLLEPDGRIVIAGTRNERLIVLRLLPNGSPDDAFGMSGIFEGPATRTLEPFVFGVYPVVVRTSDGGYRVTTSGTAGCGVLAVTANGTVDSAFGNAGAAAVSDPWTACRAMAVRPDDSLLVAGYGGGTFVARLSPDGQVDPDFHGDAVADALQDATAVAVAGDGSVLVAGLAAGGGVVLKLQADGELDTSFGSAGSTTIDIDHNYGGNSQVAYDMAVAADGSVTVAGGGFFNAGTGFVARLLGAGGGGSPGVIGISEPFRRGIAEGSEAVVRVRRTGGAAGRVSVAYRTGATEGQYAQEGVDYGERTGTLTWDDGDRAEQELRIPVHSDDWVEGSESFLLELRDAQGGAGFGTRNAVIEIAADGSPHGQIAFIDQISSVAESNPAQVWVGRDYYYEGAISVTVTATGGTAEAGTDFAGAPVTLSWADGDWEPKVAEIPIVNDDAEEEGEVFTVRLSDPVGGALIGPRATSTVEIAANDQSLADEDGGGMLDRLSALLLAILLYLRYLIRYTGRADSSASGAGINSPSGRNNPGR